MIEEPKKYQKAPFLTRFLAAIIDFGLVIFLSVFVSLFIYNGCASGSGKLANATKNQLVHVDSSHLADKDRQSYTSDKYFEEKDGNSLIISSLSYFYNVYLAGDTARASTGDVVSLNADKEIEVDGVKTTPKNLYTVQWFNVNVLKLPVGEQVPKYDYFVYQKNELNENDYSKVGVVNSKYVADGKVNAPDEMVDLLFDQYKIAADLLFDQDYMVEYQKTIDSTNELITFLTRTGFILVFYEIIPLFLIRGKTLGKLLMKLSLVTTSEESIKKYQVLLRGLLFISVPVFLYFVKNIILQLLFVGALLITSIVLYLLDKKYRKVLHDYLASTIVVEDNNKM